MLIFLMPTFLVQNESSITYREHPLEASVDNNSELTVLPST